ncbi:MAG: hypothetical protein RLZZ337_1215, partial [Bacteroidota bacterium]
LKTPNAELIQADKDSILQSNNEEKKVFMLQMNQRDIEENDIPIKLDLFVDGELMQQFETTFLAPVKQ